MSLMASASMLGRWAAGIRGLAPVRRNTRKALGLNIAGYRGHTETQRIRPCAGSKPLISYEMYRSPDERSACGGERMLNPARAPDGESEVGSTLLNPDAGSHDLDGFGAEVSLEQAEVDSGAFEAFDVVVRHY